MGIDFGLKKKEKVNIIFKDHVIRYLDSKKQGKQAIKYVGENFLPEGIIEDGKIKDKEYLRLMLQSCVETWKIKNREVQFLVPDSAVVVRHLQIPKEIEEQELKSYLYMELGTSIHLPIDNPVFEVIPLGVKEDKQEILFYAAPESLILDYSSLLEEVKLQPVAADLSPLAMYRLYYHHFKPTTEDHTLCIQFDIQNVNISIFREHKLYLMRHLKMEADPKAWKQGKDERGIDSLLWSGDKEHLHNQIDDMITEIERIIDFYRFNLTQGNGEITRIFLTGDHPNLNDIFRRINELTEIEVDFFLEEDFTTSNGTPITSRHYLSLGLSLKEGKL